MDNHEKIIVEGEEVCNICETAEGYPMPWAESTHAAKQVLPEAPSQETKAVPVVPVQEAKPVSPVPTPAKVDHQQR